MDAPVAEQAAVRVSCDDGTRYVGWDLVMSNESEIASIDKAKP